MKPTIAIHKSDQARPYAGSSFHISNAALLWFVWISDVNKCRRRVNAAESHASFWVLQTSSGARGGVVVKALCYKPAGRGLVPRWCHWNFSVT